MKKRILIVLTCIMMISVSLLGCSNKAKESDTTSNQNKEQSSGADQITGSQTEDQSSDAKQVVDYAYEQELNIIDDHYRNYYEIFVASYCDSNGDGIGDFNGIASKLDYISEMGFNGIWLMPIMPSPSYHKYDTTDFYNVDQSYGTLDDFKNLLNECHKRGIKLIIDYVFNHSSNQHPWFTEAVKYLVSLGEDEEPDLTKCPYVGYYHFTKDSDKGNTYYHAGNSSWYYEGRFSNSQPDFALESDAVRAEFEKNAKFWLDMGVDGFRLDAAKEYFSGSTDKNVEVLKWFSDYVKSVNKDVINVGEVFDEYPMIASFYKSGVESFFNFPLSRYDGVIPSAVKKLGTSTAKAYIHRIANLDKEYSANDPNYVDAPFLSNHDTARVSAQCANNLDQMKMAAGLLLTMNGSPFVYYGEEIGMNSQGNKDENKRLPMQWSITDTTGMTKGPAGADAVVQKFEPCDVQAKDPLSILNYYKRALRIRNENPEIARGKMSAIEDLLDTNIGAVKKVYEGSEIVIIYNINKEAATVDLKTAGYGDLSIRGYLTVDGSEVTFKDGVLNMPLYSIVILK